MNHLEIYCLVLLYLQQSILIIHETIHQQLTNLRTAMTITMMLNDLSAFYDIYDSSIKEILNQHSNERNIINLVYISDKLREKL